MKRVPPSVRMKEEVEGLLRGEGQADAPSEGPMEGFVRATARYIQLGESSHAANCEARDGSHYQDANVPSGALRPGREATVMASLRVELAALVIDNQPGPFASTKVEITLEGSAGRLSVENCEGYPLSVHRFTVRDTTDLGVGDPHSPEAEKAGEVLAIACSLANLRILFSPVPFRDDAPRDSSQLGSKKKEWAPSGLAVAIPETEESRRLISGEDSTKVIMRRW